MCYDATNGRILRGINVDTIKTGGRPYHEKVPQDHLEELHISAQTVPFD
jgi:hypothetical protein